MDIREIDMEANKTIELSKWIEPLPGRNLIYISDECSRKRKKFALAMQHIPGSTKRKDSFVRIELDEQVLIQVRDCINEILGKEE